MLRAAVILVTLLEPAASHEGHRCPLDGGIPPEVPNHSPQQYIISEHEPGTEEHRRELHSTWQGDAAFSPIRIQLRFDDMTELTSSEQNFLQNTLMPAAAAWAEGALAVRPVASNLLVERYCPSTWGGTGVCYSTASPETCGATGDTSAVTVPDELLAETRVCTACYGSTCEDPGSTCSTLSAGAGTAHDFVLFVSAVTSNICGGGTIAYAVTCKRDQYDRPIMGHANFCPNLLSEAEADYPKQLSTAIHELVHALGFASGSWSLFRFDDGITPRTPREADGWPALTSSFSCPTGLVSEQFVPNSNTLVTSTERGVSVTRIVTPRVASIAQDMFGCSTLPGAELENQPTGANACWGSHWEQRMHKNDLMGAVSSTSAVRSPLILALLEDTGWYRANYSYAEPQRWGRASDGTPIGCSFSTSKCLISETPIDPAHFCDDGAAVGCAPPGPPAAHGAPSSPLSRHSNGRYARHDTSRILQQGHLRLGAAGRDAVLFRDYARRRSADDRLLPLL
jgi:leishmanolysin-like peptidase